MRIEKKFLAYGHELDADITPLEAGLDFTIDWNKDFVGKPALEALRGRETGNRIVSIVLNDTSAVPLGSEPVCFNGTIVGKTTSAAFGFRIGAPIVLADIKIPDICLDGQKVEFEISGDRVPGTVSQTAAFDAHGKRMKLVGAT